MNSSIYFSEVKVPRVTGRCLHLLSDILMIGLCTYSTGGMLSLPKTRLPVFSSASILRNWNIAFAGYGKSILSDLSEKQIIIDGKKQCGTSPTSDTDTTMDKDHGRIEVRKCSILPAEEYLLPEILQAWKGLGTIIKMESSREI